MKEPYSYIKYIDKDVFDNLIKNVENVDFNKSGSNSKCAIIEDYAIIKTSNIPGHDNSFPKIIDALYQLKQDGVNVVPILAYQIIKQGEPYYNGSRYDKGYIIQEKAPGKELLYPRELQGKSNEQALEILMNYLTMLNNIPQQHYDKWVLDYKKITDSLIRIDPSKESNFFYDNEKGFSFIDLNFFAEKPIFNKVDDDGKKHHAEFILYTILPFRRFFSGYYDKYFTTPQNKEYLKKVILNEFDKYITSVKKLGITEEDVKFTFDKYNIGLSNLLKTEEMCETLNME